jgi:hypothetical protein
MRLNRLNLSLLLGASAVLLGACASSDASLRSQPASHFAVPDFIPMAGPLKTYVTLKCARIGDTKYAALTAKSSTQPECGYVSADVTQLVNALPQSEEKSELRDSVLDLLLGISDYNCSNFMGRAYAVRSTFDVLSKVIGDIATAVSAGTVSVAPAVSGGLDGLNLVVGKSNSDFDSEFYANKTFEALESAIAAERTKRKTRILASRIQPGYSLMDALSDARFYDDACSIRIGLQSLGDLAQKEANKQKTNNLKAKAKTTPEARMNEVVNQQSQNR